MNDDSYVARVLEESRTMWNKMKSLRDRSVLMTHDGELCV